MAGVVEGAVTGVRVVKGFGQEEQEIERLEDASSALFASRVRAVRLIARYNPALQAVPALGQVGVLALGGWLAITGSITAGHVPGLLLLPGAAGRPGPGAGRAGHDRPAGPGQRDPGLRGHRRPAGDHRAAGRGAAAAGTPDVELDDVKFGYVPSQPVLRGLSLRVRPGETLALVGTVGLRQVDDLAAAAPLLRRDAAARSGSAGTTSAT